MSRPNLWALTAVGAGIVAAARLQFNPVGWLLGGVLLFGAILWRHFGCHRLPGWLLLTVLLCGGAFLFGRARADYRNQLEYNRAFAGEKLTVEGRVVSRPERTEWGYRFELRLTPYRRVPRGRITVYLPQAPPEAWLSREIRATGRFKTAPSGKTYWPDFYEKRRLTGVLYTQKPPLLLTGRGSGLWALLGCANQARLKMSAVASRSLSPLNQQVLQAMLFGVDLDEAGAAGEVLEDLRRTGTVHLLSVSGLHVGFVVAGLTVLLGWLKIPRAGRIPLIITGVWFYILMTGMEAPVLRSGLMLLLYISAELAGAKDDGLNRLSLAALVLLAINPYNLFEVGFQLSFAATAGVLGLYPLLKESFPLEIPLLKLLWQIVLISIAAQVMVLPLLAYYFNQISWVAPLANLGLALPASLIVLGGLAGELAGVCWPWLGRVALGGLDWVITVSLKMIHFCDQPDWAGAGTPCWPWPLMGAYYLGLMLLMNELRPNLLTKIRNVNYGALALIGLAGLNLIVWTGFYGRTQGGYLEVVCLDVGQGDAIFLKSPDGYTVLVDGGAEGMGRSRVLPYLRRNNLRRLNLVIGTHGHADHLGGLDEVLQRIPANTLYLPRQGNVITRQFLRKITKLPINRKFPKNGERLRLGKYTVIRMLTFPYATNENDRSIVLLISYGKYRTLLTGDLGVEGEEFLARRYPQVLKATVLKVGHHGSDYASGWRWLSQVKPRVGVISVGAGNRHGHPGRGTLNRLHSLGTALYRTDRQGTIRIRIYPDRILVLPER
jgi:competence protein ComEC